MSEMRSGRAPVDRPLINVADENDVRFSMDTFACTAEELHESVEAVGNRSSKVEDYLEDYSCDD